MKKHDLKKFFHINFHDFAFLKSCVFFLVIRLRNFISKEMFVLGLRRFIYFFRCNLILLKNLICVVESFCVVTKIISPLKFLKHLLASCHSMQRLYSLYTTCNSSINTSVNVICISCTWIDQRFIVSSR